VFQPETIKYMILAHAHHRIKKKKHEHAETHVLFCEYSCTMLETETYYGISNIKCITNVDKWTYFITFMQIM
jgi:hypothetical protein